MNSETTADAPMHGLASLPVFFKLDGRRVLVAGGSAGAAWKAELLQATGAHVTIVDAAPSEDMRALTARTSTVTLVARDWAQSDFADVALAIGDFATEDEAARFRDAARRARVPVNVVDKPDYCDFQFGTIIDRSPLVVAISTGGAAPVFALALRGRIEALLPQSLKIWAQAAQNWRPKLRGTGLTPAEQRRFWELFANRTLAPDAPQAHDFDEILARARSPHDEAEKPKGSVALIGTGPGDPELITLKGLRLLQAADVVLFDDSVSPAIVEMTRREATRINVVKRDNRAPEKLGEILGWAIAYAKEGKRVVCLQGGAASILNRAHHEIAALSDAGVDLDVVPGVSIASG